LHFHPTLIVFVFIPDLHSFLSIQALTESGLGGASAAAVGRRVLGPVDADTDATITGFVLQQHLPAMLAFLAHPSPQVWHRGRHCPAPSASGLEQARQYWRP
jgi:hypothetical protein